MKEFFKNLGRYKVSSVLNILGLAIAFASAYIILVQVNFDLGYNKCFRDGDRTFRLELRGIWGEDNTWTPYLNHQSGHLFGEIDDNVESFTSMHLYSWNASLTFYDFGGSAEPQTMVVRATTGMPNAPKVMGFNLVEGDFEQMKGPGSVLLSESFAVKHGLTVGNAIKLSEDFSLTVMGIFKDFPKNCDLYGLELYSGEETAENSAPTEWSYTYYYKLISAEQQEQFMDNIYRKYYERIKEPGDTFDIEELKADFPIRLTAVEDTYFASNTVSQGKTGNRTTTLTLFVIAVLIIVIAFVNFINFFMAMVPRRIRRVNTEKIFGCSTRRLRLGFVGEAIGLVLLGLLLAALIIFYIAPEVSAGRFIATSIALEDNWNVVLMMLGLGVVLAIIASIYPAYYITSVPPAFAIKGSFGNTAKGRRLRSALLGLQFFISLALIICTMFIKLQHSFMMNYEMGFNREHLLSAKLEGQAMSPTEDGQRPALVSLLKESPMIQDVTFSQNRMVSHDARQGWGRDIIGENRDLSVEVQIVTPNFLEVMGIEITEGRNFESRDMQNPNGSVIYNETARRRYNLTMDTRVCYMGEEAAEVIGFCKDAKMQPLQYETEPMIFYLYGRNLYYPQLYIRTTEGANFEAVKAYIEECILKLAPKAKPEDIKVEFFDEQLGREYEKEKELTRLVSVFSLVAILIALMGVFGLVFFETQYRRREIAVRRVHGAKISQILGMFVGQYARMVGIAFLFAVPVSALVMLRWLQGYAYHIDLYWWVFALALLIVLAVTSAIVLARSWRAAKENPVEALYKE